jgi:NTE family protein
MTETIHDVLEPVRRIATDPDAPPVAGKANCLSGGGYRAMLFHTGVFWRLCETGWLGQVDRVSSVSGGAMTAAALAEVWGAVTSADDRRIAYDELVVRKIRMLASHTIDRPAVVIGALSPFTTISEQVEHELRRHLLGDAMLSSLPEKPKFVFNATNIGSGALVRFSRSELADWRVGRILSPKLALSTAVAAASAFPPFLSPYRLDLAGANWQPDDDNDLGSPDYRDEFALTDGGVYDNLGLETTWKRCRTVFVSDAGGILSPDSDPAADWVRQFLRITYVLDHEIRSLRKRQVIDSFTAGKRDGVYVGIRSDVAKYKAPDCCPHHTQPPPSSPTSGLAS